MKRIILSIAAFLVGLLYAFGAESQFTDTTSVVFKNKTIQIEDSVGKIKIQVFDSTNNELKKVYEGVFSDEKSYEKWTVMEEWGINIPFLNKPSKKKYKMEPHWAGFGWGFANFTNANLQLNNIDGVSLKSELSNEFYFNPIEKIVPIIGNNVGITTGLGLNWRNYHLDNNTHLKEENDVVGVYNAPIGTTYNFSRLRVFSITVPVLLEFQHKLGTKHEFFISAGVLGGVNTSSTYRIKYTEPDGDKENRVESKGLNIAPLTLDYMAQIGYGSWSVFAKYSPFDLFQSQKGPKVKAVSLGATLNF
jgi:hypothetical protein